VIGWPAGWDSAYPYSGWMLRVTILYSLIVFDEIVEGREDTREIECRGCWSCWCSRLPGCSSGATWTLTPSFAKHSLYVHPSYSSYVSRLLFNVRFLLKLLHMLLSAQAHVHYSSVARLQVDGFVLHEILGYFPLLISSCKLSL
jgi:hypothetical protein